ncbi:MAG: hypothetical protein HC896_12510, partial [Bacteroidales bacterium]|nr:hypothetical protein [Bacteroidales bacterium]
MHLRPVPFMFLFWSLAAQAQHGIMANYSADFFFGKYPTYQQYLQLMQQAATEHPQLCNIDTIGASSQGRLILSAKISANVMQDEMEPRVFLSSTMHGNETTGYYVLLRLVFYLLERYNAGDSTAVQLLNTTA